MPTTTKSATKKVARKIASPKPEPVEQRAAERRIAVIAVGEYAHVVMRRPRPTPNVITHSTERMMRLVIDEVLAIILANTDGEVIASDIAKLVGQAACEAFKLGVQHGTAS